MRLLTLFLFPVIGGEYFNELRFIYGKGLYGKNKKKEFFNILSAYIKFKII